MERESSVNEWSLPTGLASCLNKYMSKHISERHIDDKVLSSHPIPNNVKGMQKLDENIKELLSENKKSLTLNQEKNH